MKFLSIKQMRKFSHFFHELIQISNSFYDNLIIIFLHHIFSWYRRYKTPWPPVNHSSSHLIKLIKSSGYTKRSFFIMTFDNINNMLRYDSTSFLSFRYRNFNSLPILIIFLIVRIFSQFMLVNCHVWLLMLL